MRDIRFRAWDKSAKWMLQVEQLAFSDSGKLVAVYTDGPDFSNDPIILQGDKPDLDEVLIEQYTGLKDVNGELIYEGDIVRVWDNGTGFVTFKNGSFIVDLGLDDNSSLSSEAYPLLTWNSGDYEIVGNIHKNPDLLEAPHD
ncbi:YopX family protein [Levilactobacillus fuyuanensis]|uniref:YopX family protein n=1 Tax=Levilactobacillus fuyuanensis TaxID=2486022 RepID=A0ABW4H0E1_9LACO|nr:YopX family protein [Levilactobacillus fuyuanensis]